MSSVAAGLPAARRYVEIGKPERALELLVGLDADHAMSLEAAEIRCYAMLELERWADAAGAARDALVSAPDDVRFLLLLSIAQTGLDDLPAAEHSILAALRVDPDDADLLCHYASLLLHAGQFEKAEKIIDVAERSDPGAESVLHARYGLAYLNHDDAAAQRYAEQLLALDPEDAHGHRMLGAVLASQGLYGESAEQFAGAVRLEPGHAPTAEAARHLREANRWMYFPVRLFDRYGAGRTWVAWIALSAMLRSAGLTTVLVPLTLIWVVLCIWSWVAGATLKRRLA